MFFHTTWTNIKFLLNKKSVRFTFLALFLVMLLNFISNVLDFRGYDVISMYHPMKILSLSYNRTVYKADTALLIVQLLPIIVACPAGLSMAVDKGTGAETMLISRLGRKMYITSKIIAIVIVTAIVFTVPFLMEIVLNCLSFPLAATADLTNMDAYSEEYLRATANYIFPALYNVAPYLYAVLGTLCFGLFAGILAGFTASVSLLVRVKFKVFLLLPVFILLYISDSFKAKELKWYNYALLFSDTPKSITFLIVSCALLVSFCVFAVWYSCKRDCLK